MVRVHRLTNFVGEPCTGKTSFAHAAARELTGQDPIVLAGSPETETTGSPLAADIRPPPGSD
jgi:hypothetical protein